MQSFLLPKLFLILTQRLEGACIPVFMAQFTCPSLTITFSAVFLTLLSLTSAGEDCLSGHNYYRQMHGVQPLEYDRTLEQFAMKRVAYMAKTDVFAHPRNLPYGENLYWKSGKIPSCQNALDMWYKESSKYNYARGDFSSATGHFTQMIWASSQYVGCATAKSPASGRIYIACNYWPQGNVRTQFRENVPPPQNYYSYNY